METVLSGLATGFGVALDPFNLFLVLVGCVAGTLIGALPGLGPINGVAILLPIAERVMLPEHVQRVDRQAYFDFVLHHELSHGLGPGKIVKDGRETEVRLELRDLEQTGSVVGRLSAVGTLGALVLGQVRLNLIAAVGVVAFFAVFHGHAHGTELEPGQNALLYSLGFVIATQVIGGRGGFECGAQRVVLALEASQDGVDQPARPGLSPSPCRADCCRYRSVRLDAGMQKLEQSHDH